MQHSGSKYDPKLTYKDIAARIRADIKQAVKFGHLPNAKYRVFMRNTTMSCAVEIRITEIPFRIVSAAWVSRYVAQGFNDDAWNTIYTEEALELRDAVQAIHNAYNSVERAIATGDYLGKTFYGTAEIDTEYFHTVLQRCIDIERERVAALDHVAKLIRRSELARDTADAALPVQDPMPIVAPLDEPIAPAQPTRFSLIEID
jgi:hypothetical protein